MRRRRPRIDHFIDLRDDRDHSLDRHLLRRRDLLKQRHSLYLHERHRRPDIDDHRRDYHWHDGHHHDGHHHDYNDHGDYDHHGDHHRRAMP